MRALLTALMGVLMAGCAPPDPHKVNFSAPDQVNAIERFETSAAIQFGFDNYAFDFVLEYDEGLLQAVSVSHHCDIESGTIRCRGKEDATLTFGFTSSQLEDDEESRDVAWNACVYNDDNVERCDEATTTILRF